MTHYQPGKFLWIRDNDRGLRITTSKETALQVGDEVDVLGFPNQGQYTPVLEDATFAIRKSGTPPVPVPLITSPAAVDHDADLVELEAVLGESKPTTDGSMLVLDWGGETVTALLRLPQGKALPKEWAKNSVVRVTGICAVNPDATRPISGIWQPHSFQILLRSLADLKVIQPPP